MCCDHDAEFAACRTLPTGFGQRHAVCSAARPRSSSPDVSPSSTSRNRNLRDLRTCQKHAAHEHALTSSTSILRGRRKDKGPAFPITSDLSSHSSPQPKKGISLATKTEIRDIVKAELKPIYKCRLINTDEYTDINKHVSHLLYDEIGKSGYHMSEDEDENTQRDGWTVLAAREVAEALRRLGKSMDEPLQPQRESGGVKVKVSG